MADKTEVVKQERKVENLVVAELPKQEVRSFVGEGGTEYHLITKEEAITEILETVRQIKKSVA